MPDAEDTDEHVDTRPGDMPLPPGAELAGGGPVTHTGSKTVMLRAERDDEIEILQVVRGARNVPEESTVLRRTDAYFGPQLLLHADVDGADQNWQLTCPGPNTHLILWKANTAKDGEWRDGWVPLSEVKAKLAAVEQYRMCDVCDRPIRGMWHARLSAVEACEGVEI
jgi:hypothetical protein